MWPAISEELGEVRETAAAAKSRRAGFLQLQLVVAEGCPSQSDPGGRMGSSLRTPEASPSPGWPSMHPWPEGLESKPAWFRELPEKKGTMGYVGEVGRVPHLSLLRSPRERRERDTERLRKREREIPDL